MELNLNCPQVLDKTNFDHSKAKLEQLLDFTINHIESNDSDIDDKYDTEDINLFTKKFKRSFKKNINKNKNSEKDNKNFLSFTAKFHDSKKRKY